MMLADPRFMEAEAIQPLHQLQVAVHARRRVFVHRVERRQEDTVAKLGLRHDAPPEVLASIVRGLPSRLKFGENQEAAYRPQRPPYSKETP
jgi:hypothetical protein